MCIKRRNRLLNWQNDRRRPLIHQYGLVWHVRRSQSGCHVETRGRQTGMLSADKSLWCPTCSTKTLAISPTTTTCRRRAAWIAFLCVSRGPKFEQTTLAIIPHSTCYPPPSTRRLQWATLCHCQSTNRLRPKVFMQENLCCTTTRPVPKYGCPKTSSPNCPCSPSTRPFWRVTRKI